MSIGDNLIKFYSDLTEIERHLNGDKDNYCERSRVLVMLDNFDKFCVSSCPIKSMKFAKLSLTQLEEIALDCFDQISLSHIENMRSVLTIYIKENSVKNGV
jgi:hypothetical protein